MPRTPYDYSTLLDAAQKKYKAAPTPTEKNQSIVDCLTEILTHWASFDLDTADLRDIITFGFRLPCATSRIIFSELLAPECVKNDLDSEKILQLLLNETRQCKHFSPSEKQQQEQHFILAYFKKNNTDDLFQHTMTPALLEPLNRTFNVLHDNYNTNNSPENIDTLTLFITHILKSAIKHGNALILQQLYKIKDVDFYDAILKSLTSEQQKTLQTLENAISPTLVTNILQTYTLKEFGYITDEAARLQLAYSAMNKPYQMKPITVLQDNLDQYLRTLKQADFPVSRFFINTGNHWTSGYIEINKKGDSCKILLLDSLGYDLITTYTSQHGYYPKTKEILDSLHYFQPTQNMQVDIYYAQHIRQHTSTGCQFFALTDVARLHTLTRHLPAPYQNQSVFSYLLEHVTKQKDPALPKVRFVDLPLSLMLSTQTSDPRKFLVQRRTEAQYPVNKKNETPEEAIQRKMRYNPIKGKMQNNYIQLKVEKKRNQMLGFLSTITNEEALALQEPYTLQAMIKQVTSLTLLTPEQWDAANPEERLQHLRDIFKKLHTKANRLDTLILEAEIKKHAELSFLYLTPRQTKSLFSKILFKKDYLAPLSTSALFAIILNLCEKKTTSTKIADHLLALYLENYSAEALLLHSQNTASEQYIETALQRFIKNNNSEKTLTILAALVLYTIKTYHPELCIKLSAHPVALSKSKKKTQQQLLNTIDPHFVKKFMQSYQKGTFGNIGCAQLLATLAQYAEKYPTQAANTTLLKGRKEVSAYFKNLEKTTCTRPEYFIIAYGNHYISGVFVRKNQETKLFVSDATGRNAQGHFSSAVQQTLFEFKKIFKTNDHETSTAYIAETVRHTDISASWFFALRDLKNLFTLKALPKSMRRNEIFNYLDQHPASTTYNSAGLDFKIVELPPRLANLSVKKPGHQKYNRAERVVQGYKKDHEPRNTFLLYKLIRMAQKMLGFIVDKTPETLEAYSFRHTLQGCLERQEILRFNQTSLGSTGKVEAVCDPARNLSISV